ncbi:acyltransferase [Hyphobacterium sp. HN65]|uniref:Acyltransferase n=1 Tax=Hyphobacterium lacteum TaxID=3116575 RepID=A0ABU7LPK6_9PROT|nr:acyltransferase [Hyphobacterium sp. HN65]MEE2525851.1 acyltransferase [Hyphobacterium sp. HN65]
MTDRLANIQSLRALAALMVVAIHIHANEVRVAGEPLLSPWFYHGVAGVDLFFVISGFIMVHVTRNRDHSFGGIAHFWFDRVWRIYPPAILFTLLTLIALSIRGTLDDWLSQTSLISSFLLLPQQNHPLLGVAWTLVHELYFYLVFGALLLLGQRWLPLALLFWGALIGLGLTIGVAPAANPWVQVAFHPHTFEFIAGAFAALAFHRGWVRFPVVITMLGVVAWIAGALWIGEPAFEGYPAYWGRVLAFGPASVLLVLGLAGLERQERLVLPAWSQVIGDWSYSLYLSHVLVIVTLTHLWMRFAMPGPADNLLMIGLMTGLALGFSAIAYNVFERPVLKFSKRLGRKLFAKAG